MTICIDSITGILLIADVQFPRCRREHDFDFF